MNMDANTIVSSEWKNEWGGESDKDTAECGREERTLAGKDTGRKDSEEKENQWEQWLWVEIYANLSQKD